MVNSAVVYAKIPQSLRGNDVLKAFSLGLYLLLQGSEIPEIPKDERKVSTRFVLHGAALGWFRLVESRFETKEELFSSVLAVVHAKPAHARKCVNC